MNGGSLSESSEHPEAVRNESYEPRSGILRSTQWQSAPFATGQSLSVRNDPGLKAER
jgi:hypothetical protein